MHSFVSLGVPRSDKVHRDIFGKSRYEGKGKVTLNISWMNSLVEWSGLICLGMGSAIGL